MNWIASFLIDEILQYSVRDGACSVQTVTAIFNQHSKGIWMFLVIEETNEPGVRSVSATNFGSTGLRAKRQSWEVAFAAIVADHVIAHHALERRCSRRLDHVLGLRCGSFHFFDFFIKL